MFAESAMHAGRRSFAPFCRFRHTLRQTIMNYSRLSPANPRGFPAKTLESALSSAFGLNSTAAAFRISVPPSQAGSLFPLELSQGSTTRVLHLNAGHLKLSGCVLSFANVFYHFTPRETWRTWRFVSFTDTGFYALV